MSYLTVIVLLASMPGGADPCLWYSTPILLPMSPASRLSLSRFVSEDSRAALPWLPEDCPRTSILLFQTATSRICKTSSHHAHIENFRREWLIFQYFCLQQPPFPRMKKFPAPIFWPKPSVRFSVRVTAQGGRRVISSCSYRLRQCMSFRTVLHRKPC